MAEGISKNEQLLLQSMQHRGRMSIADIASQIGLDATQARYAAKRLREKEITRGIYPFVNPYRIGFAPYSVLFTLGSDTSGNRERLLQTLQNHPRVSWLGEYLGSYRYGMTLLARNPAEVAIILQDLTRKHKLDVVDKEIVAKLAMTFFPRQFVAKSRADESTTLRYERVEEVLSLDKLDHLLLTAMVRLGTASSRELSLELRVPESTLRARIEKLEASQLISGYFYPLSAERLSKRSFVVLAHTRGLDAEATLRLRRFCLEAPQVTFLVESLGAWDFEVGIECDTSRELTVRYDTIQKLLGAFAYRLVPLEIVTEWRNSPYPFR